MLDADAARRAVADRSMFQLFDMAEAWPFENGMVVHRLSARRTSR